MYVIGLNLSHDYSVCLIQDGKILNAIALERISRVLRGLVPGAEIGYGIRAMVDYCLQAQNLRMQDIDYFIACTTETSSDADEQALLHGIGLVPPEKLLCMPHPGHHLAHAYASFYGSGFPEAAALVCDAYGTLLGDGRECESGFAFRTANETPELVFRTYKHGHRIAAHSRGERLVMPSELEGIGEIYRVLSLALGFRQPGTYYDEAGKTMGLASYGKLLSKEPVLIRITDKGLDYSNALPFLASYNLIMEDSTGVYLNPRSPNTPIGQFHKDLAAQVQWELEEACIYLARKLREESGLDYLVLGGGTFLNSVTNYRILNEVGFKEVYIFPASTDDGTAVGAAYYGYQQAVKRHGLPFTPQAPKHVYLGRSYPRETMIEAIETYKLPYETLPSREAAADFAANALAEGKIVGWYQDGAEFGPRALGHRSILANPLVPDIKDIVNNTVKFREGFRPFAPAVLQEKATEYFEIDPEVQASLYMLLVSPVHEHYRSVLPGITHVDDTARVQTVTSAINPLFYRLIEEFGRHTGVSVVLNTSFNLKGMPIVEQPRDALQCFIATQIDYLIMDRYVVPAPDFLSFVPCRNDLDVRSTASWPGSAPSQSTKSVRVLARNRKGVLQHAPHEVKLSPQQWALLERIDGRTTMRAVGYACGLEEGQIIPAFLRLYRDGLIYWQHLANVDETESQLRAPTIGALPYQE